MAAVTICSDFGVPQNKVWHCFHCFPKVGLSDDILSTWTIQHSFLLAYGYFFTCSIYFYSSLVCLCFVFFTPIFQGLTLVEQGCYSQWKLVELYLPFYRIHCSHHYMQLLSPWLWSKICFCSYLQVFHLHVMNVQVD